MDKITSHICMSSDMGVHGNLFGGKMVSWIDEAAAIYANMYCDSSKMVTVKISELIFKEAVKLGNIVNIYGEVKSLGKTSITLHIEVKRHDPVTGKETLTTSTDIVFVRIGDDGHSVEIDQSIQEKFKKSNTLIKQS